MARFINLLATIASGASLSGVAQPYNAPNASLQDMVVYGIVMPAAWDTANLTFQASHDRSTYNNVYADDGTELTVTAAASRFILVPPVTHLCASGLIIRSGTAGTPVNQTASRNIIVLARMFD